MRLTTSCRMRVPIIGGQIEQLVLGGLKSMFAGEGEFTAGMGRRSSVTHAAGGDADAGNHRSQPYAGPTAG